MKQAGWRLGLKRTMDLVGATVGLCVAAPVMCIIAVATLATSGAPVLFRQTRLGRGGRPFEILKIRTMTDARDESGRLLPDAERLTPLGCFLRRSSLDELPQLWNVLRGDMSLVGPRPLVPRYLGRYTPEQARRHEVLQGITGWAQVNGRDSLTWEATFALDVWYVEHWDPWLDVKILGCTVPQTLRGEGVVVEGSSVLSEFMGPASPGVAA